MNWSEIFERRPDLQPPGYLEAIESLRADPIARVKRKAAAKSKTKPAKFPSAKHATQD